jgi:xylan 1,4-beta-xylosidase
LDFTQQGAPFRRGFNGCVGSGHALLGLRSDWRKHLASARSDLGVGYIRFHGILDDDMSVVRDDGSGYSFFNTDSVLDYIISLGMLPVVELSFMPRSLAARPNETIFHYNGITSPPTDWQQFSDLIVAFVSHHVDRYGLATVQSWYYEVWNEPNCGFWTGTKQEYLHLYQVTVLAVKSVHKSLRVGGPATCQVDWIPDLIAFAKSAALPLDFISSHLYPTDPNVPQVCARARMRATCCLRVHASSVTLPFRTRPPDSPRRSTKPPLKRRGCRCC